MHADTCGADWTRLSPCPVFSSRCLQARARASSRRPRRRPTPRCRRRHRLFPSKRSSSVAYHKRYMCLRAPAAFGGSLRAALRAAPPWRERYSSRSRRESRALHCAVCWVEMVGGSGRGVRDNFAPEDEGLIHKREVGPMVMGELRTAAARRTPQSADGSGRCEYSEYPQSADGSGRCEYSEYPNRYGLQASG